MTKLTIATILIVVFLASCSPPEPAAAPPKAAPPPAIVGLPVSMTVKQRSTTTVPGTKDELSLKVGDITRGQVQVSLIRKGGTVLLKPASMKGGDAAAFRFGDQDFTLKLTKLENTLVGEDSASFLISSPKSESTTPVPKPGGAALTEMQKIEQLIVAIESLSGAIFVRNGVDYSAKDAGKHLRQKLDSAQGKISTAAQFVDSVASKSSISGEEYKIRFKDGKSVTASDFLRGELTKLEKGSK